MPSSHGPEVDKFYQTAKWKKIRRLVITEHHGICNRCGAKGTEVHHIIPLTKENYKDPAIALDVNNLELLCWHCHNKETHGDAGVRDDVMFDEKGNLVPSNKPNKYTQTV